MTAHGVLIALISTLATVGLAINNVGGFRVGGLRAGGVRVRNPAESSARPCRSFWNTELTSPGQRFLWSMSGLDADNLRIAYTEGAFAPNGTQTVLKYPRDYGQSSLGLEAVKVFYDYSTENSIVLIRMGRWGQGPCIFLTPDLDSYSDLITALRNRNATNQVMPDDESVVRLVAREVSSISMFSQVAQSACTQDGCGQPIETSFYLTEEPPIDISDDDDDDDGTTPFSVMLTTDRFTISGLPHPRDLRRQMKKKKRLERRLQRIQNRRMNRRQNRRKRRRDRRQGRN